MFFLGGFFWVDFFGRIFLGVFFGCFFWVDFFGWIFLGWIFLGGFFWVDFFWVNFGILFLDEVALSFFFFLKGTPVLKFAPHCSSVSFCSSKQHQWLMSL